MSTKPLSLHLGPSAIHRVRVEALSDQVLKVLGRRLLADDADLSEALPSEHEIADEFGVSRTVARQVIRRLRELGLVDISQGRRMVRRPDTEWDYLDPVLMELLDTAPRRVTRVLADLHEVRVLLEPAIAAAAAGRMTSERREAIVAALDAMQRLRGDPDRYLEHDLAFHMELVRACDNLVLTRVLLASRSLLRASRRVTNLLEEAQELATAQHQAIADAVLAGDPARARAAMKEHLDLAARAWVGEELHDLDNAGLEPVS